MLAEHGGLEVQSSVVHELDECFVTAVHHEPEAQADT